jgi:hypothetical protein
MFRNGRALPQQDDRRKDKVDAQVDYYRHPNNHPISLCEVQLQNVGADAEFDQGHAVEVE